MKPALFALVALAAFTIAGCTTNSSTTEMQAQGSGVRDASDVNAGAAAGAAASGPIGYPGR